MAKKQADSDFADFTSMHQLPGIRRLNHDKVNLLEQRPKTRHVIHKIELPEIASTFIGSNEFVEFSENSKSWFDSGLQKKLQRRIRTGQLHIDDSIDLHGLTQNQALSEIESFFKTMQLNQARFVLIVHGKGYRSQQQAVLKPLLFRWLQDQKNVLAWCPAQPQHGGHGATYVYLRNSE